MPASRRSAAVFHVKPDAHVEADPPPDVPRGTLSARVLDRCRPAAPGCRRGPSQFRLRPKEPPMSFPDEAAIAPSEAEGSRPLPPAPLDPPPPPVEAESSQAMVDVPEDVVPAPPPAPAPARRSAQRPLPRIIAVANQKCGVGKTTTTINVGACLAELGQRTLIIDLDPQGNASTGLGIENRGLETSMYHVLMHEVPLENCIEPTDVKGLFVAPASLDLAGAEIELVPAFSRETRLKRSIDAVLDDYDYVLIDCPPSLGLLTVNGLSAAREVLVPIQCEYYALEGLGQLLRNVDRVRHVRRPDEAR